MHRQSHCLHHGSYQLVLVHRTHQDCTVFLQQQTLDQSGHKGPPEGENHGDKEKMKTVQQNISRWRPEDVSGYKEPGSQPAARSLWGTETWVNLLQKPPSSHPPPPTPLTQHSDHSLHLQCCPAPTDAPEPQSVPLC